jgi:hypothetical protein
VGLYSDILEDNRERQDPWSAFQGFRSAFPSSAAFRAPAAMLHPCPSCSTAFASREALGAHLFERHRTDRFYVRVNGRPSSELSVIGEPLRSVVVVPLGSQPVHVRVSRDGALVGELSAMTGIETELILEPVEHGLVVLDCATSGRSRSFEVYVSIAPPFDHGLLDGIVTAAQAPLEGTAGTDFQGLRNAIDVRPPMSIERRYLDGFAEYLLAHDLDGKGQFTDAGRALERAWGRLLPFGTDLARSAMAVIAFRFHAMEYLTSQSTASALAPYAAYLSVPPAVGTGVPSSASRGLIWVDQYQEALFAATRAAIEGRPMDGRTALAGAPASLELAAGNQRKFLILTARLANEIRDSDAARAAYQRLLADPIYGAEAKDRLS